MRAHVASFQNIKIIAILFLIAATLVNGLAPAAANAAPVAGTDTISVTSVTTIQSENQYDLDKWQASFSNGDTCHRSMNIHQDKPATGPVQSFSKPWWAFGGVINFTDAAGNSWTCNT